MCPHILTLLTITSSHPHILTPLTLTSSHFQVLSSAALELAQPGSSDNGDSSDGVRSVKGEGGTKPWEEVLRQRLRAKTRIISKVEGPDHCTHVHMYCTGMYPTGAQQTSPPPLSKPLCSCGSNILLSSDGNV